MHSQDSRRPAPVLLHPRALVSGAPAAVERREDPFRNAAGAKKEAVRDGAHFEAGRPQRDRAIPGSDLVRTGGLGHIRHDFSAF